MDFIADMGVSIRVVSWLRNQGFDAVHLRDRGLQRLPDKEVFELAIQENRIVLTFDLDFGEIVALSSGAIISVLLFRLHNTTTDFVIKRLEAVLAATARELADGAIVVIEDGRHRIRKLPVGS